jgi:hypothetical protein
MMAKQLSEVNRNDIPTALALAEERLDAGTYTAEHGEILAMLQDDPTELATAFGAMIARREAAGLPVTILAT